MNCWRNRKREMTAIASIAGAVVGHPLSPGFGAARKSGDHAWRSPRNSTCRPRQIVCSLLRYAPLLSRIAGCGVGGRHHRFARRSIEVSARESDLDRRQIAVGHPRSTTSRISTQQSRTVTSVPARVEAGSREAMKLWLLLLA
jgi:hypothetical protein